MKFQGDLKDYRQPLVTSTGIILGFMLNFLAGWAHGENGAIEDTADAVILATILCSACLFVLTLLRALRADFPAEPEAQGRYYATTLWLFLAGISTAFLGLGLTLFL